MIAVNLPGRVGNVVVGGGGRYLVLLLPDKHQLAIFDVNHRDIVHSLNVAPDTRHLAAGMDRFVAEDPDHSALTVWSFDDFQVVKNIALPTKYGLSGLAMGSASAGPLLVAAGNRLRGHELFFIDLDTGRRVEPRRLQPIEQQVEPGVQLRASPDGRVFTSWLPNGDLIQTYTLTPGGVIEREGDTGGGPALASARGTVLFTRHGCYTEALRPITATTLRCVPAHHGPYWMSVALPDRKQPDVQGIHVHLGNSVEPLARVIDTDVSNFITQSGDLTLDQRIHLIPKANLLVLIPPDKTPVLELYRVDLKELLEKSDSEHLAVVSEPPPASPGRPYHYSLTITTRDPPTYCQLVTGPAALTVSPTGLISWTVPDDYFGDATVTIRVSSLTRETRYTFVIPVAR
jgi:hypothetical protein